MDTLDFDVLVIGAGIAGATAAAHCAADGRVALMEAEETAGYHSTGRSAAIWIQNTARRMCAALRRLPRLLRGPPAGFAGTPLLAQRPVVTIAPADQAAALQAMLESGEGLEPISLEEVAAMGPPLRAATPPPPPSSAMPSISTSPRCMPVS
jgi:D-arginine dehydrogenase